MRKHKWLAVVLAVAMLLGMMPAIVAADGHEGDCPAAPDVAGQILSAFTIDFRYESGEAVHPRHGVRTLYSNYIAMVAQQMTDGAAFPAYGPHDDLDDWDGETYVDKCDEVAYYSAVYHYLRALGAELPCPYCGVLDPVASGAVATDNDDGTVTLVITVVDLCGNPIVDLNPRYDFSVMDSVIGGPYYFGTSSIPGSTNDKWIPDGGVYAVTLERNFFNARPAGYEDGWYRIWDIYVLGEMVEDGLILKTTYWMVGAWKMDLYNQHGTLLERFIIISTHVDGDIDGFFGVGYDPEGVAAGSIEGTVTGRYVDMDYESYATTNTGRFWGTIAVDGNSITGEWFDNTRTGTWTMTRQ